MLTCGEAFKLRGRIFLLIWTVYGGLNSILTAQVGIGTTQPHPSALLELSSQDQGLLLPRVTLYDTSKSGLNTHYDAQQGLLAYNVSDSLFGRPGLCVFDGNLWRSLAFAVPEYAQWQSAQGGLQYAAGEVYIGANSGTNNNLWLSRRLIDWDNSNYFLDPAAGSVLNEIKLDQGSTADVSLYWDRPDTGFFAPSPGAVGLSVSGNLRLFVDSLGRLGIGTGAPEADLDLSGSVKLGANGSVINGVRRFTTSHTIPSDWPEEFIVIELDQTQLQSLGMSSSALIHVQLRGSLSRLLSVRHQGMDEQGYHISLEGIVPSMLGQSFEIDYLAFF